MSVIKFEVQKEVFERTKERLHSILPVDKLRRKKNRKNFLCITGSIERPIRFSIYHVKKTEKGFKRKEEWGLSALKAANYKDKESVEFELELDKLYQWEASSLEEKDVFFSILFQISARLHRPPKFLRYEGLAEEGGDEMVAKEEVAEEEEEEFGLTEREEADLEKVLARVENAVHNCEAYMDTLARELSILDGENIQSIMESEGQVACLMESLDQSIGGLGEVETELTSYEETVGQVRRSLEKIEAESLELGVASRNNVLLREELSGLVQALQFPDAPLLLSLDLRTVDGRVKATIAAHQLQLALNVEDRIHPALLRLKGVVEQKKSLERISRKFAYSLADTFRAVCGETWPKGISVQNLHLPSLSVTHAALRPYAELSAWLKGAHPEVFSRVLEAYSEGTQKIYAEAIKELFKEAARKISSVSASSKLASGSTTDLQLRGRFFGKTRSLANKDFDTESQGSGEGSIDSSEREHYYDVLEEVLEGLSLPVNGEEAFLKEFFHLEAGTTPSSGTSPVKGHQANELRKFMVSLFASVEAELGNFLSSYEKLEPSFCMGGMVKLGEQALRPENSASFISVVFGTLLVQEKRSFDRLMNSYVDAIADTRLSRKQKPEILPFVAEFEDFAVMAENIFEGSARRSELEKWYVKMLGGIFEGILRHAADGGKIPGEVLKMENFHRLHAILCKLKVGALESQRKEAKAKYNEALNAYVTKYLGRPLVKLNEFFDGVQGKVSQGVKESEVGYQMSFSRAELKRVIREYPAKEVKRGLDSLYKKLEKHLSEEENLLQVVWRAMQEEFIVQYKSLESLIGRCYPGAKISLEFTIEDILLFFSEIAQSH